jgi:hypothetical protein
VKLNSEVFAKHCGAESLVKSTRRMWDNTSHDLDVKRGAMGLSMGFVVEIGFSFQREKKLKFLHSMLAKS